MRIIVGAIALLMSVSVFAKTYTFKGKGHWHSDEGEGSYKVRIEKTTSETDVKMLTTITSGDKTMLWEVTFKKDTNHTSTVYDKEGNPIGSAYCFHSATAKTCHMDVTIGDLRIEQTIHADKLNMRRMGSKINAEGKRVLMWEDSLLLTDIDK